MKMQKSDSLPDGLLQLWEDYRYLTFFDWACRTSDQAWMEEEECETPSGVWLPGSPQLIRILRTCRVIQYKRFFSFSHPLLRIHLQLGISWDEIRTAICLLRPIIGESREALKEIMTLAWRQTLIPDVDLQSIQWNLVSGTLRLLRRINNGGLDQINVYL
jgi:hypothetical protein